MASSKPRPVSMKMPALPRAKTMSMTRGSKFNGKKDVADVNAGRIGSETSGVIAKLNAAQRPKL